MTRPMSEEREKLEPCPFCGGHAELTQYDAAPGRWWRVECRYCCAKSPGAKQPELAVPGWNRRSTSAAVRGMREALEGSLISLLPMARAWVDTVHAPNDRLEVERVAQLLCAALSSKGEG